MSGDCSGHWLREQGGEEDLGPARFHRHFSSPLPRRHGLRIGPQAFLPRSCYVPYPLHPNDKKGDLSACDGPERVPALVGDIHSAPVSNFSP